MTQSPKINIQGNPNDDEIAAIMAAFSLHMSTLEKAVDKAPTTSNSWVMKHRIMARNPDFSIS